MNVFRYVAPFGSMMFISGSRGANTAVDGRVFNTFEAARKFTRTLLVREVMEPLVMELEVDVGLAVLGSAVLDCWCC